jgi:hypothetical protein
MNATTFISPNSRKKEACQPRFPMEITSETFYLVAGLLAALDFSGPVALSCDDTKLFATYRLYWDAEKESHFLVGGTGGPLQVADPEEVKKTIEVAKAEKATKVCSTHISQCLFFIGFNVQRSDCGV